MRLLFVLAYFVLTINSQAQDHQHFSCKSAAWLVEAQRQLQTKQPLNQLTQDYDLKYHRLEWVLDPSENYISGQVTAYFVPTSTSFQAINFDFASNMTVNEVRYHGNALNHLFSSEENLQIDFPQILPMGQLDSVTIVYEGAPAETGFGAFQQGTHLDAPILWTLSEPYGALAWWPCKQDLNDKVDSMDVIIRTPEEFRAATSGVLINEYTVGEDKVYHWKHRYPIAAYLVSVAVTNYVVYSDFVPLDDGDSLEILNYVFPESLEAAQNQLAATIPQMELFNDLFGIYPFVEEKYGNAQFILTGGGIEHQTMSFMGNFSFALQAHELAHQWFGNKVTCGSWQDIWLNEGFAAYFTGVVNEFLVDEAAWFNWKKINIEAVVAQSDGSVWVEDTTNIQRIFDGRLTYQKGPLLMHMLRWKLGDADFYQSLRNYLDDPQLAYGYARAADFKAHLEAQGGMDLTAFFNDWYYNQGHPSYQITWSNEATSLRLLIDQTTSHPSVDFFEMPLPILVSGQGQDSLLRLDHLFSGQLFDVALPFEVEEVIFDPDLWLISANNTVNFGATSTREVAELANALQIMPNPVSDFLQIKLDAALTQRLEKIELRDLKGRQLISRLQPEGSTVLSLQNLPAGTYLLVIATDKASLSRTIIKH
ncbi:MAG: M1 family aminopeptidase [Bacteroidota bacterium]